MSPRSDPNFLWPWRNEGKEEHESVGSRDAPKGDGKTNLSWPVLEEVSSCSLSTVLGLDREVSDGFEAVLLSADRALRERQSEESQLRSFLDRLDLRFERATHLTDVLATRASPLVSSFPRVISSSDVFL